VGLGREQRTNKFFYFIDAKISGIVFGFVVRSVI